MNVVALIGPFPPPVHGMAVINDRAATALEERGCRVVRIDTSSGGFGLARRIRRSGIIVKAACDLRRAAGGGVRIAWLSVSGGLGKAYELALVRLARKLRMRVVLHHHAWTNVGRHSPLMAALTRAAGPDHVQIALCEKMAERLRDLYAPPDVRVISNLAFLDLPQSRPPERPFPGKALTLGFLGNITLEKGIDAALEVAERFLAANPNSRMIVAGPIVDAKARRLVESATGREPRIEYRGPVYGIDKQRFLAAIDVILFPSRKEAEPLVVYEAIASGVIVLSTRVGCIDERLVRAAAKDYIEFAVSQLETFSRRPDLLRKARERGFRHLRQRIWEYRARLSELLASMEGERWV